MNDTGRKTKKRFQSSQMRQKKSRVDLKHCKDRLKTKYVKKEKEPFVICCNPETQVNKAEEDNVFDKELEHCTLDSTSAMDAYSLEDSHVCEQVIGDSRWTNKQRTLVFSSRGITQRQRHFLDDLKKLLPHSKSEPKWEKKSQLSEINEICESHSCNNCVFLETRKNTDLYMWVVKTPMGPSVRFQVLNIHTHGELKMTGNCLLYSRPLLIFDKAFHTFPHLTLIKEMFTQAFGTPRNHPKSKPFFDHVFCFFYFDHKIWFRHYQISPITERDENKPLKQCLTEIGPRFVLNPIKIFEDSFAGRVIYKNPHYINVYKIRGAFLNELSIKYTTRKIQEHDKKVRRANDILPKSFLTRQTIYGGEN